MQFIQPGTCLIPLPILLDALGTTVVAGFEDGVIRFVSISVKGGLLHYAIKPSRAAIVSMAVSDDGTNLAVSSADKTIFFFALHKINGAGNVAFTKTNVSVTPVGFIKMKEVAKTLSFGAVSEHRVPAAKNAILCHRLLITTLFKYIFDVIIPTDLKFDTSSTFEIPEGAYRIQEWKPDIPVCVEEAKEVALTKSRQNLLGKDEKRNLTSKEATPKQSNQNLSQAGTPGSANKLDIVGKDSASSKLLFGGDDLKAASVKHRLNLTVDSKYSIAIYVSEDFFIAAVINENDQTSSVIRLFKKNLAGFSLILGLVDGEATTLAYDHLKNQLSVGTINGIVSIFRLSLENLPINLQERIPKELIKHESQAEYVSRFESSINNILFEMEKADPNFDIENPSPGLLIDGQIWSGHLHDAAHGKITGVSCSFDNSYLISAGTDGGIFVWKSKYVTSSEVQIDEAAIIEQLESANMAVDILESSAYSIQDETLQSEKDKELGKAEKKKEEVKAKILSLRKQYQAVLEENYKASDTWQLSKSELVVDPFLAEDIKKDLETKVEETRKELTWQSEKDLIGANKLITKFLHPLQTERIELHAFKNSSSVKSFRCLKFETPLELLDSFSLKNLASNGDKAEKDRVSSQNLSDQVASKKNAQKSDKFQATIKKLEARRLFKEERAALWKQLLEERPDETYQDPNDLAAIQQAKTNMGDYKLKCAVNYVVPENERETSSSKKRHIQLANEGIKSLKKVKCNLSCRNLMKSFLNCGLIR